ncbi:MAG: hypothetical protein ACOYB1_00410 [Limnohabitans sp.]
MAARLLIADSAYVLSLIRGGAWVELSRLPRSAQALLPGVRALDEGQMEAAIQVAEDWLAPHAAALQGEVLEVSDVTGRLVSGFAAVLASAERALSIEALERAFLRVVDLATGRVAPPHLQAHRTFVADLLLLRELAHHGRLSSVRLISIPP